MGQIDFPVNYGTIRLRQLPRPDGKYRKDRSVSVEVDLVVAGSTIYWSGVDSANNDVGTVAMYSNRRITVFIIPPPGQIPTPTPGYPGQTRLAFVSDRETTWKVYIMNHDGYNPRSLSIEDAESQSPDWSPNAQRIAFDS